MIFLSALNGMARTLLLWLSGVYYFAVGGLIVVFSRDQRRRRRRLIAHTSSYARFCLKALGVRIEATAANEPLPPPPFVVVSNHVSYLDILVLASLYPSSFITSMELRDTPFLGWLARLGGSVFVERRNRASLARDVEQIKQALCDGFSITLFPEGTSSNGEQLLPFHSSLLAAAEKIGVPVVPIDIGYMNIGGRPVTWANRDTLFYYGGISFFPHFLGLPFAGGASVTVHQFPALHFGIDGWRKQINWTAQNQIAGRVRMRLDTWKAALWNQPR